MIRTSEHKYLHIFVTASKRNKIWRKYEIMYGEKYIGEIIRQMLADGILEVNQTGKYIVSERGNKIYKRGWVYHERRWYDADIIRKYSFILSIIALMLSIIGTDNIRKWAIYLWQYISRQ
jgi:hypothetical protein